MNPLPRQTLCEIVARYGRSVVDEPRRCEGLLRDFCGEHRREISVLVSAIEERVAADLLGWHAGTPRRVLLSRLVKRLCDHLAVSEDAARWAVESWALALGVVSATELETMGQERLRQAEAATRVPGAALGQTGQTVTHPGPVVVVSAKGDGNYPTISEGIRDAAPGTRLLVRPGVYNEGFVINKPVEIIGDGPSEDIIIRSTDSSCLQMQTNQAMVQGLTLRGRAGRSGKGFFAVDIAQGKLVLEDCDITSDSLSCVAIHGTTADPAIRRCKIHDGADSGIYTFDEAAGRVEECDIYGNANVGVAITQRARPVIRRCKIYDGENAGVVVWKDGAGLVEECEVFGHRLTGVGISEGGNPVIRQCQIHGGENSGVFVHQNGRGTLEDCDIFGNQEAELAITFGGNAIARRCKIHNGQNSGVFIRDDGQGRLEQCDVYDNAEAGVVIHPHGIAVIRQSNINRNGQVAIKAYENGTVSAEDCDLTGNRLGAWETEAGSSVRHRGNRE
jgi:hypothetical protein